MLSKPEVGSSRSKSLGNDRSSIARLSLRFCPPDRPPPLRVPTTVSASIAMPSMVRMRLTRPNFFACGMSLGSRKSAEYIRFSYTVSSAVKLSASCAMYAVLSSKNRRARDRLVSRPLT